LWGGKKIFDTKKKSCIWKWFLKALEKCDLISSETKRNVNIAEKQLKRKIHYVPKGFIPIGGGIEKIKEKQNIICTCGRLGTYTKNTQMLLETWADIYEKYKSWSLVLIGSIEEDFYQYLNNYKNKYPEAWEKIKFAGYIENKKELHSYYSKSKIFAFTSRRETFGIVLAEVASCGRFIVSTNADGSEDIIKSVQYGELVSQDNYREFGEKLQRGIDYCLKGQDSNTYNLMAEKSKRYYSWDDICGKIVNDLMKYAKKRNY